MDDELRKAWLHKVATENRYRSHRRANHEPKNLQSTGHPHLIDAADPNPKVISNAPKKRFSREQRDYLKGAYVHHAVHGELQSGEARNSFAMRSVSHAAAGEKAQDEKAANRSAKRSAKNLSEYGYVVLSYGKMDADTDEMMYNPNQYQPVLVMTATMAAVEKGREFCEQDGEPTDPEELQRQELRRNEEIRKNFGRAYYEAIHAIKSST